MLFSGRLFDISIMNVIDLTIHMLQVMNEKIENEEFRIRQQCDRMKGIIFFYLQEECG